MIHPQQLVPHIPDLVEGFTSVTAFPVPATTRTNGILTPPRDPARVCEGLGFGSADYRMLRPQPSDHGVSLFAFRDADKAKKVAMALRGDVLTLPAGFPEMITRTSILASAYAFATLRHPGVPFNQIAGRGPVVVTALTQCSYLDRAVAVLASTRLGLGAGPAAVWAAGVTDAYGFTPSKMTRWRVAERAEPLKNSLHADRDIERLENLADAYSLARTTFPEVPLSVLIAGPACFSVLRNATPRTRAIALAAVALPRKNGEWDIYRAAMLIDQAEIPIITEVLSRMRADFAPKKSSRRRVTR
jgi:hypothetical protein